MNKRDYNDIIEDLYNLSYEANVPQELLMEAIDTICVLKHRLDIANQYITKLKKIRCQPHQNHHGEQKCQSHA